VSRSQRTLLVSFGNFAFSFLQLPLVICDDEHPRSLSLGFSLTSSPLVQFHTHMLDPVAMDDVCDVSEVVAAKVEDRDGSEDGEADCLVLGAIRDDRQIGKLRARPRFARLHQHVVSEIVAPQGFSESL
jgi:hypothetical protein